MKKSVITLAAATLLMGCLSACGTSTGSVKASADQAVVIAEAPQSSPNWFFPIIGSNASSNTNIQTDALMYKPLLFITSQGTIDYSRSLASSIQANANGTVYTVHLNPKWHWSNGKEVSAQDLVFTFNLFKYAAGTSTSLPWSYAWSGIGGLPQDWQSAVATGPETVQITVSKPVNPEWFILNGLGQISPVPASVWNQGSLAKDMALVKSVSNTPAAPQYQVVDGPYRFQSMKPNLEWTFVANSDYDGHKATIHKLVFEYETSTENEFLGLKNGTIQVGYLPASSWDARTQLTGDTLSTPYILGYNFLQPNLSPSAPGGVGTAFAHAYVRQALEMGIDQPGIISSLFHGNGVVEDAPIASQPPTQFYDPALSKPLYPFNPAAGKKLLENHGWHLQNGVMTKNGVALKFTMLYMSGDPTLTNMVSLIKSNWAQEGIQVNLQSETFASVIGTANQSDPTKWQMAFWGGGWTYEPDFYPSGDGLLNSGAGANFGGYANAHMDQLINATTNLTGTPAQVTQRMDAYLTYAAQQVPVIWLPWTSSSYVGTGFPEHAKDLHGTVSTFNLVTDLFYPNYWTLSGS